MPLLRGINIGVGEISWASTKHWPRLLASELDELHLKINDVVVAMDRPWIDSGLKVAAVRAGDVPCLLVQRVARLRAASQLHQGYLKAIVNSDGFAEYLRSIAGGTAVPHVSASDIQSFPLLLPPVVTQRRIAAVLSAFDELIEINERRITLLEDLGRSLYREWFVHFRFPGHEQVEFVDSALGPIPEEWEVRRLDSTAQIVMGQSPKSEFYNEIGEGLPFHQGVSDYGALLPIHRKFCTLEGRRAEAMDVLCSVRAPVGRLNVADQPIVIGRGLAAIRRYDNRQALVLEQLRNGLGEEDSLGGGTIFKAIGKEQLGSLPIAEPSESVARRFEGAVRPMFDERIYRTLQTRYFGATRDLLLPGLVTGRLDISDVDLGDLLPDESE
jgi:type I restriction enzyme S subunit